ncbi:chlorohydrolase [Bifidobacterium sp. UTBIF-68]|uniref:amidohydrolase family protein n=1 Tax=Bifidobacterium sp. UTBIF-68 TaxID=1465262 RepID=UPI00112781AA|nr:amidohydrolase [Bifidobacterium sp. UTBIF-68]TPF92541.1 chlorohydrolase [Bifidobacterium sp. UTBIF-68]
MIVLKNGVVLTNDKDDRVIWGGTVCITGNRITYVGDDTHAPAPQPADTVIDCEGSRLIMPGLVDLHYHTCISRGEGDWLPLMEWLDETWYPYINNIDPESAYHAAMASYCESIKAGVTCVNDMYRQLPSLARAAEDSGMRAVLSNDVMLRKFGHDNIDTAREAYEQCDGKADGRVEVYIGYEWMPKGSPELLREVRALADELDTGIHIHLNESLSEIEYSKEQFGRRPAELAYENGVLGPDCVAAHCVWLSDTEIAMMAETGTSIAHNPLSNAKLGSGIARVPDYLARGVNVGIGHDAAKCADSRDLWENIRAAAVYHRGARVDSSIMPASTVLKMATVNGNKALHHDAGSIETGRLADVVTVDLDTFAMTPLRWGDDQQLCSHLVYSNNGSYVLDSIIDGRIVMRDRQLTMVNERDVIRNATKAYLQMRERLGK